MVDEEIVKIISRHLGEDAKRIIENQNEEIERLNNIINELNNGIKELDNMFYETFRISQNGYYSISEWELKNFTDKLQELKGVELTENDKKQVKWLKEEFNVGVDK